MYSIYDEQTEGYLYSGRNSKTEEDCVDAGLEFLISDWDEEEILEVKALSFEERKATLKQFELTPREHDEMMDAK